MSASSNKFPPQIKYIVGNEACERYSYYGMRSILVVFMIQYLLIQETEAIAYYHYFAGACYLLPLFGAYISDRFLGKYKTILLLSVVYCLGHLVLALWENQMGLYWGLGLIAVGSGGIKPCVSAHVGDQFNHENKHLIKKVFDLFYWMINFGSTFSTIITPWTLTKYGPAWAFGVPGILMFLATIVFWMGRHQYVHVPPSGENPYGTMISVVASAFKHRGTRKSGESFFDAALKSESKDNVDAVKAAFQVFKTFSAVTVFWALFDQHGSSWVVQATKMVPDLWGMTIEPSQMAALNPIIVMALIPLFSVVIYPQLAKRGYDIFPLKRMTWGMFIAVSAFIASAIIEFAVDGGVLVHILWQFFPYLLITVAEVLISITGLEFAYTQAPRSMKSTIMSFWLLTVFFGNMLTAYVAKINVFQSGMFYVFFAVLMLVVSFLFAWIAKNYKSVEFVEA